MEKDKKTILKKLMRESLQRAEEAALINRPEVEKRMLLQWDAAADGSVSSEAERRIWNRIRQKITRRLAGKEVVFYKLYSLVASVVLVLGLGGAFYFADREPAPLVFVASSGIQNYQSVSLPDGTEVQMGPGSKLTYPEKFTGKTREVSLEGQAFFDVAKEPRRAFVVHAVDMDVTALGTAFEVFSYQNENKHETILLNGKVKVGLTGNQFETRKELILSPNQMLVYDKWKHSVSVRPVDANTYSAWRNNGMLSFENEKLSMIIPRLEQWFGRKIICSKDMASKYRFTFKIKDESLERTLFMFSKSSPVRYREINGNYELY